jgi:hypothetical protein
MIATACVLAMMSGGVWAWQPAPQSPPVQKADMAKKSKRSLHKKAHKGAAPAQHLPAQTMPPIPATLMNSAPVTPHVTMASGLLTIDAPNSTLSDVLSGVHAATGAAIEGATPSERVAVKLGPGDPEQVIAALLHGTAYDYVILGSLGRRDVVTRVLLTQQTSPASDAGSQPAQTASRPQQQQPADEGMPDRPTTDDAASQPNPDNEPDQAQQPAQPPQQPPQPQLQQQQQQQQQQQDPNQQKTPEQLFNELQQLEQQKQPK